MKNIKLYDLDSTYHAEQTQIARPFVAYTKDEKKVYYGNSDSVGSILAYDSVSGKLIKILLWQYLSNTERFSPEGVLVIPASHCSDKKARYMSLVGMSVSNPESGNTSDETMYCGGYGQDIPGLFNFTQAVCYPGIPFDDATITRAYYPYLPSTNFSTGNTLSLDGIAHYNTTAVTYSYAPSPYLANGKQNPVYLETFTDGNNALSDMNGKNNTDIIIATCDPDELVCGGTVTNLTGKTEGDLYQSHAPAVTSHRYHTEHTASGDWYLPSCGEFGYTIARLKEVNSVLSSLRDSGVRASLINTNSWFWTSTEYSGSSARELNTGNGSISGINKSDSSRVRAFLAY